MTLRERLLITPSLLVAVTLAAFMVAVPSTLGTGHVGIAFAQNQSMMPNQTTTTNQTVTNQTGTQMANETATNQTSTKLTTSDLEDIRKSLEGVRKSIADGKAVDALKTINEIDDKLLISMGDNPPQMLEKSTGSNNK